MVALKWLRTVIRHACGLRSRAGVSRISTSTPDGQLLARRLDADDSYWWILGGGIHVPGYGPEGEG
ncbi:hypothetical protein [Arthrobacter sp. MMS24-S77]